MQIAQNAIIQSGWIHLGAEKKDETFAAETLSQATAVIDRQSRIRRTFGYQAEVQAAGLALANPYRRYTTVPGWGEALLFETLHAKNFARVSSLILDADQSVKVYSRNRKLQTELSGMKAEVASIGGQVMQQLGVEPIRPGDKATRENLVTASVVCYDPRKKPHNGAEEKTSNLGHRDSLSGGVATMYLSEPTRYARLGHQSVYEEVFQGQGDVIWMENRVDRTVNDGPFHAFDTLSTETPAVAVLLVAESYEAAERFDHLLVA